MVQTTNTNTPLTNTTTTSSWLCGTYRPEESCASCIHRHICKYRDAAEEAMSKIPSSKNDLSFPIKLKLTCEYYKSEFYTYPSITYRMGDNDNSNPLNPLYEVTCQN